MVPPVPLGLVHNLDGLDDEELLRLLHRRPLVPHQVQQLGGGVPLPPLAVGLDHPGPARVVPDLTVHWLAGWHARCDQGAELHHLRGGEAEGVEVRLERLVGLARLAEGGHDGGVGRAPAGVDQHQLGVGGAVDGDQVAHEDLVGGVALVDDLEDHGERVADDGRLGVVAAGVLHAHDHVGRVHGGLLVEGGGDLARDGEVDGVGDGLVGQVVGAGQAEAQVVRGHDAVVVLEEGKEFANYIQLFVAWQHFKPY